MMVEIGVSLNGSMFSITVPAKRVGFFGIHEILFLRAYNPTSLMFTLSIRIEPSSYLASLNRA